MIRPVGRVAWAGWVVTATLSGWATGVSAQHDLTPPPPTGGARPIDSDDPVATAPTAPEHEAPGLEPSAPPTPNDSVSVESAAGLATPRLGGQTRQPEGAVGDSDADEPWSGPRVELGYTHYVLADGHGGGDVDAGVFGGYLPLSPFRLGGWAEMGVRNYALGQDDALVRATALVGYQYMGWGSVVPYVGAVATFGIVFGKRFRTPVSHFLGGGGLELGADANLVRSLYAGFALAYERVAMQGAGFDLFILRLRVGL